MATETESIELSSLRITGHRSVPRTTEDVNVNQPEPTVIKTKCNVVEKDDPSSGDSHGSPRFESAPKIKRRGRIQFAALCFCLFLIGYHDGMSFYLFMSSFWSYVYDWIATTGPLLPTIQRHYHVRVHSMVVKDVNANVLAGQLCCCVNSFRLQLYREDLQIFCEPLTNVTLCRDSSLEQSLTFSLPKVLTSERCVRAVF